MSSPPPQPKLEESQPSDAAASGAERLVSKRSPSTATNLRDSSSLDSSVAPSPSASSAQANQSAAADAAIAGSSKRRRRVVEMTRVACKWCRESRAKCNGQSPCERCQVKILQCQYPAKTTKTKADLRQEIQEMQETLDSSEQIVNNLRDTVKRLESVALLAAAQTTENTTASASVLDTTEASTPLPATNTHSHKSSDEMDIESHITSRMQAMSSTFADDRAPEPIGFGNWGWSDSNYQLESTNHAFDTQNPRILTANPSADESPLTIFKTGEKAEAGPRQFLTAQQESQGLNYAPGSWTEITDDIDLIHHLLALFFCWEYPTFISLSREHFILDFRNGTPRYCSPILVNAMLALGCRFSNQSFGQGVANDPFSAGDLFFQEAVRLLNCETDLHSLPTIQAFGLLSLREISCGRQQSAQYFAGQSVRLAFEMCLHTRQETKLTADDQIVRSATFWGVYALDNIWSAIAPSLPHSSKHAHLPPRFNLITVMDNLIWIPYADEGSLTEHPCIQPARISAVFNCFSQLSEILHRSSYQQQMPFGEDKTDEVLGIYESYLAWYSTAPDLMQVGRDSTPSVLFLHMYYQFAILTLFRPFVAIQLVGPHLSPRHLCSEAAISIQNLFQIFSRLYTLRRAPAFASHILTAACTTLVALARSDAGPNPRSFASADMASIPENFPTCISQALTSLSEIATSQKGAQRDLIRVQYLVHVA